MLYTFSCLHVIPDRIIFTRQDHAGVSEIGESMNACRTLEL